MPKLSALDDLTFDNKFVNELDGDVETHNVSRQVMRAFYSLVEPKKVVKPTCLIFSPEVADLIDLDLSICQHDDFAQVFGGNRLVEGMRPYATCYGGHQFGQWAGQLGDGRAINLGDVVNSRKERWALQLKGAGRTPYSRHSDGLAVLRSSIREFLCSEAMYHLGIPTTRALSLVTTGESVVRDMFYDGHPQMEPGAIVCRVAPTFTRFGHFEIFAARGEIDLLQKLLDFTLRNDFTGLGTPCVDTYLQWYSDICQRTVQMVVHWLRVGFVHGVMNTDNMSILGLTIDYGPYGWLDDFNVRWTPNTTDAGHRRYHFGNQSNIAFWNLAQLGNAIFSLIKDAKPLQECLQFHYSQTFQTQYQAMMLSKLGLSYLQASGDETLIDELIDLLQAAETDMTIFFRQLASIDLGQPFENFDLSALEIAYYQPTQLDEEYLALRQIWFRKYAYRFQREGISQNEKAQRMNRINPIYVLRNYLAQIAIDEAENGNMKSLQALFEVMKKPYQPQAGKDHYAQKRPDWAKTKAGCSMLSCSS